MTAAALAWRLVAPWLSIDLIAVPFVIAGYVLGGRGSPRAWAALSVNSCILTVTGIVSIWQGSKHIGLLFAAGYVTYKGLRNWRANAARPVVTARRDGGWDIWHKGRRLAAITSSEITALGTEPTPRATVA